MISSAIGVTIPQMNAGKVETKGTELSVKDQFFHIHALLDFESEHTLMVEKESQRTHSSEVTAEFIHLRENVNVHVP